MRCKHFARRQGQRREDVTQGLAFYDRALCALLPMAMRVQGWSHKGVPVVSGNQRINLAEQWAYIVAHHRYPDVFELAAPAVANAQARPESEDA